MEKDAAGFPHGPTNSGTSRYLASRLPYIECARGAHPMSPPAGLCLMTDGPPRRATAHSTRDWHGPMGDPTPSILSRRLAGDRRNPPTQGSAYQLFVHWRPQFHPTRKSLVPDRLRTEQNGSTDLPKVSHFETL